MFITVVSVIFLILKLLWDQAETKPRWDAKEKNALKVAQ